MFFDSCDALKNGVYVKDLTGGRRWECNAVRGNGSGGRLGCGCVEIADV